MELNIAFQVLLLSILESTVLAQLGSKSSILEISQGRLQGSVLTSRDGRKYSAFLKVPYAQAGRFQPPMSPPSWSGIFPATNPLTDCVYMNPHTSQHRGTEDCLNLNVYTPKVTLLQKLVSTSVDFLAHVSLNPFDMLKQINNSISSLANNNDLLPVIVVLHGGAFSLGGYNDVFEQFWMDRDVVLVYVHYRIGPFGFLSTADAIIPGNFGLKDQQMALQWVHVNIEKFGGNPKNVVLLGQGSGSASVNLHMISAKSTGLFHGAILQSGCALDPWAVVHSPAKMAFKFGKVVGCDTKDSGSLFSCLLRKTTDEILDGMKKLRLKLGKGFPVVPFGPVIESPYPGSFLTVHPLQAMQSQFGVVNKVPVMIGVTETHDIFNQVSHIFQSPSLLKDLNHHWKKAFPIIFQYNKFHANFSTKTQDFVSKRVRKFYFHNKIIDEGQRENFKQALSDRLLNSGMKQTILLLAKHQPVFPFIVGGTNQEVTNNVPGQSAGFDVNNIISDSLKTVMAYQKTQRAEQLLKLIQKLVVSFAKDRRPVDQTGIEIPWNAVDPQGISQDRPLQYYRIGLETALIPDPFSANVQFWEKTMNKAWEKEHKSKH